MPAGVAMAVDLDELPTVLTMERQGFWGKPCLGCCAFHDSCKDGMFLHAGLVDGDPGQIGARNPTCVGYATQPTMGGGTVPTINIMDRGSTDTYRMLAKVEGPQCFGGCMELCYSSECAARDRTHTAAVSLRTAPCPLSLLGPPDRRFSVSNMKCCAAATRTPAVQPTRGRTSHSPREEPSASSLPFLHPRRGERGWLGRWAAAYHVHEVM
eukprot:3880934-Prymnesium_polylepis.1